MQPDFRSEISQILQNGIAGGAFPGAVGHLSRRGETLFHEARGNLGIEVPFLRAMAPDTLFDLASVSKIYTLCAAFSVLREAKIDLDAPISRFFPGFDPRITIQLLMAHASGISFAVQKLEHADAGDWIAQIIAAPLQTEPGTTVLYSCTNFFLLARLAEHLSDESLDVLIEKRICAPLQLEKTTFEPKNLENVAPTERKADGDFFLGVVHDEAARSYRAQTGNCAGNAGVFATASDVSRFAQIWANQGENVLHPEDAARAFVPLFPENTYQRGFGFQINAAFYMSERAPFPTAGHTGFTGPSMFVTPGGDVAVVLNNRVHPTRSGPERMPFHRAVADAFFSL
jgi:CubicO group peptidase (beta-lactamase class C family)